MSLRWERFGGNTAEFAVRVSFYDDPHDGQGADLETASSWGAIQIWLDGTNICAHLDQGETLSAAHWYLLPTLEWLAKNWDALFHEERLPLERFRTASDSDAATIIDFDSAEYWEREERRFSWSERHALRTASDGGVLPDLQLRRLRDKIEFSWAPSPIAGAADIDWQAPAGYTYKDPALVTEILYEVLSAATERLAREMPESSRIQALKSTVSSIPDAARSEVRTAWLAGLGQTAKVVLEQWMTLVNQAKSVANAAAFAATFRAREINPLVITGSPKAALLFGSTSPTLTQDDAFLLVKKVLDAYVKDASDGLQAYRHEEPIDSSVKPWSQGYDLAEDLFDEHPSLVSNGRVDVDAFLAEHSVKVDQVELEDRSLRAVSFAGQDHQPTIIINSNWAGNRSVGGRRFTLAHELGHLLFDRGYGTELAVASGPWAPLALEQRANAFAAMLLMPPRVLRSVDSAIRFEDANRDIIESAAQKLGVSLLALIEHLHNVGMISEARRFELQTT